MIVNTVYMQIKVKRGEQSWAYLPLAYSILLTILYGIVPIVPYLSWITQLVILIIGTFVFYRLCFFNDRFRNKIIGVFSRSREVEETYGDQTS